MSKFVYLFGLVMTDGRLASTLIVLMCLAASACALPPSAPSTPDAATLASSLQLCADEINRYRTSVGRAALTRSDSLEQFAATAAQHDASAREPHSLFSKTNGGGVAIAETELLLWPDRAVHDVIKTGLAQMWSAGPSGEHYGILSGPYTQVGCGVYVSGGEVSVAQDYR